MLYAFDGRSYGDDYLMLEAGARVALLPPRVGVEGGGWAEVTADGGRAGWVPLAFLGR
jgi:hypothetical protein